MDGPHSSQRGMEKEKIKEMLRDAVRILCQNTVSHHTKLTIEAVIGITVDDGEDSVIISINESVGAAEGESHGTDEPQVKREPDETYHNYDLEENMADSQSNNSLVNYNQQYHSSVPYQAVVKKETSVISYNLGQYATFPPSSDMSDQATNQYYGYEPANYGHQAAVNMGRGQKTTVSRPRRGKAVGRGVPCPPQISSNRSMPTAQQNYEELAEMTNAGGRRSAVAEGEVSHVTLYTCQRCGKQMGRYSSFLRHKKSHLGIIYRCDGCGKIVSRADHLTAHRKRCPAAQQQAPLD